MAKITYTPEPQDGDDVVVDGISFKAYEPVDVPDGKSELVRKLARNPWFTDGEPDPDRKAAWKKVRSAQSEAEKHRQLADLIEENPEQHAAQVADEVNQFEQRAQAAANDILTKAQKDAETVAGDIIGKARAQAEKVAADIVTRTRAEADKIVSDAKAEADGMLSAAEALVIEKTAAQQPADQTPAPASDPKPTT